MQMNSELRSAADLLPVVPPTNPGDESLLSDEEICRLSRDGEGHVEAVMLRLRDELISGQSEPGRALALALSRFTGERADRLKVFASAIAEGRLSDAIFTLNRILAYS